jgi:hypothetical protein
MKKLEKFIYSTFYSLINPDNFGVVKFFQKYIFWEIASLTKNCQNMYFWKKDNVANSKLLHFFY